jgi:hypothetical protein
MEPGRVPAVDAAREHVTHPVQIRDRAVLRHMQDV